MSAAKIIFFGLVAAYCSGCANTPPARFYTLSPLSGQGLKVAASPATNPISVRIAPVELPDYLDRLQIVTRDGANGLRPAEFERWGGSLADNITMVLVENLSVMLSSDRVFAYSGGHAEKPDYLLVVRVLRLDCLPGERVDLKVQWLITTGQEKQEVARRLAGFSEKVADARYDTMVTAINRTLEQLSRELSSEIGRRPRASNSAAAVPPGNLQLNGSTPSDCLDNIKRNASP